MPQPILYVAITNHGFGHASRTAALAATVQELCPEALIILVTAAPRWLLESYLPGDFIHRPWSLDVGVVQSDSIKMDKAATLTRLKEIQADAKMFINGETNFIKLNRAGLVLADIPPLAAPIAHSAGIPCWMASNFGWDSVYRPWGGEFEEMADWISECFGQCDRLYRLPFHEPMSAFPNIIDMGLTGGSPRFALEDLRSKFNLTAPQNRTVLLTFGGLGLDQIPYANLEQFPDWQFITFDRSAPDLPNLLKVTDAQYRPVDFMPLCDRVVSKPGYGTFSEACRLDLPITSITREDFSEAAFLIEGIQDYSYHQVMSPQEFFKGDWEFLRQSPQPPRKSTPLDKNGNEAIARAILDYLHS
jgi:hypothetical protein